MRIEKKLRRAFRRATPQVLDISEPQVPQKRRRLSDRAKEFIATAAALALIISAVGGGFVYYRQFYTGNSSMSTDPTGNPLPSDPDVPPTVSTEALTPEAFILRAQQIVCPDSDAGMESSYTEAVYEDAPSVQVTVSYKGYTYIFHFCAATAVLWEIEIPQTDSIKEDTYITPTVAQQIGLIDAAKTVDTNRGSLEVTACEEMSLTDDMVYLLNITYRSYSDQTEIIIGYYVDPYTGEITFCSTSNIEVSRAKAIEIAFAYAQIDSWADVTLFDCVTSGNNYSIDLEVGSFRYEMDINLYNGFITNASITPIEPLPQDDYIKPGQALNTVLIHADLLPEELYSYHLSVNGGAAPIYKIDLSYYRSGSFYCQYTLDARTGQILHFRMPDGAYNISTLDARNIALEYTGVDFMDSYQTMVAYDSEDSGYIYVSLQLAGEFHSMLVSQHDGSVKDYCTKETPYPIDQIRTDMIGWRSARDIALAHAAIDPDRIVSLWYSIEQDDTVYQMMFQADTLQMNNAYYIYKIDAFTGKILSATRSNEPDAPDYDRSSILTTDQVLQAVVEHGNLTNTQIAYINADPGNRISVNLRYMGPSVRYHVTLIGEDTYYYYDVDVYTGKILDSGSIPLTQTMPDTPLSEELAIFNAIASSGYEPDRCTNISWVLKGDIPWNTRYEVSFTNPKGEPCDALIHAYTLKRVYHELDLYYMPHFLTEEDAVRIGLEDAGYTEEETDALTHGKILHYDEAENPNPAYWVWFRIGNSEWQYTVDAATGEIVFFTFDPEFN